MVNVGLLTLVISWLVVAPGGDWRVRSAPLMPKSPAVGSLPVRGR